MREIDLGERRCFGKSLGLITPKKANELRIVTESPVFVSPDVKESQWCTDCGLIYGPLVYNVGLVVNSHHFHNDKYLNFNWAREKRHVERGTGGIYYYEVEPYERQNLWAPWIAYIKPLGVVGYRRAEKVLVERIYSICTSGEEEIEERVLWQTKDGDLYPTCYEDRMKWKDISFSGFSFKIENGQVLFFQS